MYNIIHFCKVNTFETLRILYLFTIGRPPDLSVVSVISAVSVIAAVLLCFLVLGFSSKKNKAQTARGNQGKDDITCDRGDRQYCPMEMGPAG